MLLGQLAYRLKMHYDIHKFRIVSYNLHGINNGRSFLVDLCNDSDVSIVAVQEHWLTDDNLYQLSNIHPGALLQATSRVPRCWIGERPPDMVASCDIYK